MHGSRGKVGLGGGLSMQVPLGKCKLIKFTYLNTEKRPQTPSFPNLYFEKISVSTHDPLYNNCNWGE